MEDVNTHEAGAHHGPAQLSASQALQYSSSENLSKMPSEMPLRVSPRLRDSDRLHMAVTPMGKDTVNGICADLMMMNNHVHDLREEVEHLRDQNSILQTQVCHTPSLPFETGVAWPWASRAMPPKVTHYQLTLFVYLKPKKRIRPMELKFHPAYALNAWYSCEPRWAKRRSATSSS